VRALEVGRNTVVDFVDCHIRWVIPSARVVWVNGLTILPRIVRHAIIIELLGLYPHERKLLKASHRPIVAVDSSVADEELMVALVVHVHAHLELDNTAGNVDAVRLPNSTHVIAASRPLVTVSADRSTVPTMGAIAVLAGVEHISCRGLHQVAVAGDMG